MEKELMFSVTAQDCEWSYTKGTGAGGQKRNKTSSAVHCKHKASGAMGYSESSRSQHDNKIDAFTKMANSKTFKDWLSLETMRRTGQMIAIYKAVEQEMRKIKIELIEDGRWVDATGKPLS